MENTEHKVIQSETYKVIMAAGTEKSIYEQAFVALLGRLESGEKFALEQAPDVCKQLVAAEYATTIMDTVLAAVATPLFVCFSYHFAMICEATRGDDAIGYGFVALLLAAGAFLFGAILYCQVQSLIVMKIAPKVFLIQKIREIIRGPQQSSSSK